VSLTAANAIRSQLASIQTSLSVDTFTEILFRDNFEAQAIIITATAIISIVGISRIALRLTRSNALARFFSRRGIKKQGPGLYARVNEGMSAQARAYQTQITGRTGEVYIVNDVKFDGFNGSELLDGKGPGYANFIKHGEFRPWFRGAAELLEQAENQLRVAGSTPVTWHVAEGSSASAIKNLLERNGLGRIKVVHTPAKF
jgi:hypothetical protein